MPTRPTGRTRHEIITEPPTRRCGNGHLLQPPNVSVGLGQPADRTDRVLGWTCRTCGDTVWDTAERPART